MKEKIKKLCNQLTQPIKAWNARRKERRLAAKVAGKPKKTINYRGWFKAVVKFLRSMLVFALAMQVLKYFVPDLPSKMPTWYQLSELVIQFFEWLLKVALGCLKNAFSIEAISYWREVFQDISEGWQIFMEFISGISL